MRAARLQPVADKQNITFGGDSTALKPQGTASVATPDYPADKAVDHNHALPRASNATGESALGDDRPHTSAAAPPSHADRSNQNMVAIDDSLNTEGAETRSPAHPGGYDTTIARPESRKGLGSWSTRDHENGDASSSDVENLEGSSGGHPALGGLSSHKNGAHGQHRDPDTRAVLDDEINPSQGRGTARPHSAGDAASRGVGSIPELTFDRTSFGGDVGSEREGGVVESVAAADRSTVQTVQGLTRRNNSHGNALTAEQGAGDASNSNGFAPPYAEAESPRSGRQYAAHTASRRSGGNFAEEQHQFEAVGVGVKSRTDQSGGDGVPSYLDDNRRQQPRQSETYGGAQVLRRQSSVAKKDELVPETGEGHQRDQGISRREPSGGVRRYDNHDQQHRGVASGTGKPVDPSNKGVHNEALKPDQKKGGHERPGTIAGSYVGETRANRRPRKTSAAAGGAVGERPRKPVRPVVEVPHAVHPRVANSGIARIAPDGDGTVHVYNIDTAEGNEEARARVVRTFVPAAGTREVEEDVSRSIAGHSKGAAVTFSIGQSLPQTKPASMTVAEPAIRTSGRIPKGGGAGTADERGQDIAASISTGAKEVSVYIT